MRFSDTSLKVTIFVDFLISSDKRFHCCAPLQTKLDLARVSLVLGIIILPVLLSSCKYLARYYGSPDCLILKTVRSVWYVISWFTVSHFSLVNIGSLSALGGEWITICAALFWRT